MLNVLPRIIHEMDLVADLPAALTMVVHYVCDELSLDASSIFLLDEDSVEYVLLAGIGIDSQLINKLRIRLGEGLIGLVGGREEPVNLSDATVYSDIVELSQFQYHGFLGIPIIYQGKLFGVLVGQQRARAMLDVEIVASLVTLSVQLASDIADACDKGAMRAAVKSKGRKVLKELQGIPGAQGVAIGKAVVVFPPADLNAVPERQITNVKKEREIFETALSAAREEIHQLQIRAQSLLSVAEQALFDAYMRILDSRSLMNEVIEEIEGGQWAQGALKRVIKRHIMHFEAFEDVYLRERAADFRDLGRRILAYLQTSKRELPDYPKQTILVSEEVTATAIMEIPRERLVGIVSGSGSANSHVAILARALGLPTVMGLTGTAIDQLSKKELIVDGYNGLVYVSPAPAIKKEFQELMVEEQQLNAELETLKNVPAKTKDGHQINLFVNTGLVLDGELSLSAGAEGVGLYRTELTFMMRDRFPSETEQHSLYHQLLATYHPRPVVMRTLDIGGDKTLPYFPVEERNPFLGWRGIRVSLDHPEIFLQQVRAMLSASVGLDNLSIMLPMISSVSEIEESLALINQAYSELIDEYTSLKMPKIGLMVEVPAAVYQAYEMAKRVDFLSVGSNDLIQYLLAVDRNNPHVANAYNSFHPAVLMALQQAVKGCHKAGKPISICGELAGDPLMVVLLLAMGFDILSMSARALPRVKWVIRQFNLSYAKELLKQVLKMDDPIEIRNHMEMVIEEHGLAGLIRAGKS